MVCVCSHFHQKGVFVGLWGSSTDLVEVVTRQLAAGRPTTWPTDRVERLPLPFSITMTFLFSCRHVSMKSRAESTLDLTVQPGSWACWPTPRPVWLVVWPTQSTCQIHPRGDDDFDIWPTSLCHPLKCSNLVPKFLKSDKH
jgi:hypothetical protein